MDEMLTALDAELRALVAENERAYHAYYGMMQYHLGWVDEKFAPAQTDAGKRLRPLLCLLSCEAAGGDWRAALPLAAAVELVHNFSLLHDDIEDQSDARRGRATVWKIWGLAQGLNAGDGMFILARLALNRLAARRASAERWARISLEFDEATLALCQGQFLDLSFETRTDVSVDDYLQMIRGKSAALVSAATKLGAMIGTDNAKIIDAFAQFGENIGLAFQMADDILGIWGDPKVTGKSAATDILSKKKSLPALIGLNHAKYRATLSAIYLKPVLEPVDVRRVLDMLDEAGARDQTQKRADEFHAAAQAALARASAHNRASDQLREIAAGMTRRVR
ncbi:MAG: polyprenyl synthetase family protein [Chloroflexi bacterium]|nr:polyprenyl synthetase family protein [Chloroflexota bacterium]